MTHDLTFTQESLGFLVWAVVYIGGAALIAGVVNWRRKPRRYRAQRSWRSLVRVSPNSA
jgi:hypothetical protein